MSANSCEVTYALIMFLSINQFKILSFKSLFVTLPPICLAPKRSNIPNILEDLCCVFFCNVEFKKLYRGSLPPDLRHTIYDPMHFIIGIQVIH